MIKDIKKIIYITTKSDKIRLLLLLFATLISTALDLFGIVTILPVISLLTASDTTSVILENDFIRIASNIFQTTDKNVLSIILICLLAFIFIFKCFYSIFLNLFTSMFTASLNRRLSTRLLSSYLNMPYEFHLEHNSSTLIRNMTNDVGNFVNALWNILNAFTQLFLTVSFVVYLFITDWIVTLIIGSSLILCSFVIVCIIKPKMFKIGKRTRYYQGLNYKLLTQSFDGIKESKISNTEDYFITQFANNTFSTNRLGVQNSVLANIPKNLLETIGMLAVLVSLLIITLLVPTDNLKIISKFTIFIYAIMKLLPAVNVLNQTINSFSYYDSSICSIYDDIILEEDLNKQYYCMKNDLVDIVFNDEIKINNVSFCYKGTDKIILDNINCSIHKGESIAFIGASGAGKTTLVDIILGLLSPTKGNVYCDNKDVFKNQSSWHKLISYIPQNIFLCDDSIKANIGFGKPINMIKDEDVWEALEKADLKDFVMNLPDKLETSIGEKGIRLSGGQRQRIGIARAFYRKTQIIVFDEATSALDVETESHILSNLFEYSNEYTIIIITHRLSTIEGCDHIYKIENASIIKEK